MVVSLVQLKMLMGFSTFLNAVYYIVKLVRYLLKCSINKLKFQINYSFRLHSSKSGGFWSDTRPDNFPGKPSSLHTTHSAFQSWNPSPPLLFSILSFLPHPLSSHPFNLPGPLLLLFPSWWLVHGSPGWQGLSWEIRRGQNGITTPWHSEGWCQGDGWMQRWDETCGGIEREGGG